MSETTLSIKKGQSTNISLPGKALSGYQWNFEIENKDIVSVQKTDGVAVENGPMGQNNDEVFKVEGLQQGKSKVTFTQKRNWEQMTSPIGAETYYIEVS